MRWRRLAYLMCWVNWGKCVVIEEIRHGKIMFLYERWINKKTTRRVSDNKHRWLMPWKATTKAYWEISCKIHWTNLLFRSTLFTLSGGKGRVHPSPQPAGQRGKEEESSGAGERGAEGATAGPGGGQTGPAAGDWQGRITISSVVLYGARPRLAGLLNGTIAVFYFIFSMAVNKYVNSLL